MKELQSLKKEKRLLNKKLKQKQKELKKEEESDEDEDNCECCLRCLSCLCCCTRRAHECGANPFIMYDIQNYNREKRQLEGETNEIQEQLRLLNEKINVLEKERKKRCCL